MKRVYRVGLFVLPLLVSGSVLSAPSISMIRVACYGENAPAKVYIDNQLKGDCPIDVEVVGNEKFKLVAKKGEHEFEQEMQLGIGVVKKIEVDFSATELKIAEKRQNEEKSAEMKRRNEAELRKVLSDIQANMVAIPNQKYEMSKYEVTQQQWRAIMGQNPSQFIDCGDSCPVEKVSWNEVQEFINKLNKISSSQYRLPNEVEWMLACQGAKKSEYCGGSDLDNAAWHDGNSDSKTHPIGKKQANAYGLYDMSGNVWEWVSDCWETDCNKRILKGGSWNSEPQHVQAEFRNFYHAAQRRGSYGFRLARTLP